jgi:hypothetical protein
MPRLSELRKNWNNVPGAKNVVNEESFVVDDRGRTGPAQMVEKKFFDQVRRGASFGRRKAK